MELDRSSGILIHITSLPSPFGIGDMGPEAYEYIDFLEASGHRYWQLLPINPTDAAYNHSPYSSDSAFAGNILLISPELLEKEGYIDLQTFDLPTEMKPDEIDYQKVSEFKKVILENAFENFKLKKTPADFKRFCKEHSSWLGDYSLYKALHHKFHSSWSSWPVELRDRKSTALKKATKELSDHIEKIKFYQFLFFKQWKHLTEYAHLNHIDLIGDIPFYINHDSADCWANSQNFKLNNEKYPTKISGVPPDYYSETGQLWGTPVYDWKTLKKSKYGWWIERLRQNLLMFDLVRLDHFRAFSAYWEVAAKDKTAVNGKWVKTPGTDFFKTVKKEFPQMPFIAEDLGSLDEPVYKLLKDFDFPGMKVLQFAFGEIGGNNPYLPFNHLPNNLVYTGTHDNNTTRGWFINAEKQTKHHLKEFSGKRLNSQNVHKYLHRMALGSVANLAIIPMQDIIGLGSEAKMNIPGSTKGNWTWRMTYDQIPVESAVELKSLNELYGRNFAIPDHPAV
jgi:4-alpha-glucanotransferase